MLKIKIPSNPVTRNSSFTKIESDKALLSDRLAAIRKGQYKDSVTQFHSFRVRRVTTDSPAPSLTQSQNKKMFKAAILKTMVANKLKNICENKKARIKINISPESLVTSHRIDMLLRSAGKVVCFSHRRVNPEQLIIRWIKRHLETNAPYIAFPVMEDIRRRCQHDAHSSA